MKTYSYKSIKCITKLGITFTDGYNIMFEESKKERYKANKIDITESHCFVERDLLAKEPYFLFYSKDQVKVIFNNKGIFSKKRNRYQFHKLQMILNGFGIRSFDMT